MTLTVPEPDGRHTFSWFTVLASTPRTGGLFSIPRVAKPPPSISCGPWPPVHQLTEPSLPKVLHSIMPYHYGQPRVPPLNSNLQPNVSLPNLLQLGTAAVPEGVGDEGINEHMVAIETPVTRLLHDLVFSRVDSLVTTWVFILSSATSISHHSHLRFWNFIHRLNHSSIHQ